MFANACTAFILTSTISNAQYGEDQDMFSREILYVYSYSILLPMFLLFLVTWQLWKFISTRSGNRNQPPSPPKLPIIGHLHKLGVIPHRALHSLAREYGPLMRIHMGSLPVLIVSSVEGARDILKTHDSIFSNRSSNTIARKLFYNNKGMAFAPYGEYWRQIRSVCVLQFLTTKRVQSFRAVREEETALMIENIERLSSSGMAIDLGEMFVSLANDVVCRAVLGRKYSGGGGEEGKLKDLLGDLGRSLGYFDVGEYIPWLRWVSYLNGLYSKVDKFAKKFDVFLESVVEDHAKRGVVEKNGVDFVDVLLQFQREKGTAGYTITRDTIKALILDVFSGGTDTTVASLEWIMAEILRNPRVLNKLQNEVREIGGGKPCITEDELPRMQYLKAVIKEGLRLHPPAPIILRESIQNVRLMGYEISPGTQVYINSWAIGRDPKSWDQPEEFRPERFFNTSIDYRGHDFGLIPFGAGRRGCPGIQFATSIDELALANLVYKFNFHLPDGSRLEDMDMTEAARFTIHKKLPLLVVATLLN